MEDVTLSIGGYSLLEDVSPILRRRDTQYTLFNFEGSIRLSAMNLENCTMYNKKLNALRH